MKQPSPRLAAFLLAALPCLAAHAQGTPSGDAAATSADPLAAFAWLGGCWRGGVNRREFREHWKPGDTGGLSGVGTTLLEGKPVSSESLRLEARADGVYYVIAPADKDPSAWKFAGLLTEESCTTFTFANPAIEFPQKIAYRRASDGWLYATLDGKVNGAARQVVYPMRRIDCATGELIRK